MTLKLIPFLFVTAVVVISCNKDAGKGGTSSIRGKIEVDDYNQTFTTLWAEYDGADRDVYIIYGNHVTYNDDIKTGPDGVFQFDYLTKGLYTIYVYSKDTSLQEPSGQVALKYQVEINENKQLVELPTITVFE